ncbi:MAG: N-acetylmuramoyl-L-alanine amidase [Acidimicrobiia bacterium]|nr:N-acetylmuramoyl-L-alanine amidase [Acidimicrobiia bacterium]MDH3462023.1 N-acetylmuramoyl-L-alanine amidase [Acidimicrobiia bacterium]
MARCNLLILSFTLLLSACAAITGADLTQPSTSSTTPAPGASAPSTSSAVVAPGSITPGLAIVRPGGVDLYSAPAAQILQTAHQGLILPVLAVDGSWLEVLDSCSNPVWVKQADVDVVPKSIPQPTGNGFDLSAAVVVVDAGHGGRDWGAPGPSGTRESDFNLDIADRLRDLLLSSHDIDWATGRVEPGDSYPALAGAWMTRDTSGPEAGDFEAGLAYRATMANSVGADALLAIHNNTGTDRTLNDPPTAVFYAVSVDDSDRLASLIDAEMVRAFDAFAEDWQGSGIQGTAARVDADTGTDFYGLLRRSESPAVIIEGAFVSDPEQERLLETSVFRQAYAEGVYRGLIRFLTTSETGSEIREPELFAGNVGSPSTTNCVVPTQP